MSDLRILVLAADPLARTGLARQLEGQSGLAVAGQAALDEDLAGLLTTLQPDVLLIDTGWAASSEGPVLPPLPETMPPLVALLSEADDADEAWSQGAKGLLLRTASSAEMAAAIQAVAAGQVALDPAIAAVLMRHVGREPGALTEQLTPREREVLLLLAAGLANKEIAGRLSVSEHTAKFHVNSILTKLGARSRTDAVVKATRLGLISL